MRIFIAMKIREAEMKDHKNNGIRLHTSLLYQPIANVTYVHSVDWENLYHHVIKVVNEVSFARFTYQVSCTNEQIPTRRSCLGVYIKARAGNNKCLERLVSRCPCEYNRNICHPYRHTLYMSDELELRILFIRRTNSLG